MCEWKKLAFTQQLTGFIFLQFFREIDKYFGKQKV